MKVQNIPVWKSSQHFWSWAPRQVLHPLSLASCKLFFPAYSTNAWSNWNLRNLKANSTPWTFCHVFQTISKLLLQRDRVHGPAERGHHHQIISMPWGSVSYITMTLSACLFPHSATYYHFFPRQIIHMRPAVHKMLKITWFITSGHIRPLIPRAPVTLSAVHRLPFLGPLLVGTEDWEPPQDLSFCRSYDPDINLT